MTTAKSRKTTAMTILQRSAPSSSSSSCLIVSRLSCLHSGFSRITNGHLAMVTMPTRSLQSFFFLSKASAYYLWDLAAIVLPIKNMKAADLSERKKMKKVGNRLTSVAGLPEVIQERVGGGSEGEVSLKVRQRKSCATTMRKWPYATQGP